MTAPARRSSRSVGWFPWAALALVVVVLFGVGTIGRPAPSPTERAQSLAATIRCPSCLSQSANSSDTPSSQGVRVLIRRRIAIGDSNEQIRNFVAARYPGTSLEPPGSGFAALVWALPAGLGVVALAVLAFRFRDWRPGSIAVSDADRDLVAAAMGAEAEPASASEPDKS